MNDLNYFKIYLQFIHCSHCIFEKKSSCIFLQSSFWNNFKKVSTTCCLVFTPLHKIFHQFIILTYCIDHKMRFLIYLSCGGGNHVNKNQSTNLEHIQLLEAMFRCICKLKPNMFAWNLPSSYTEAGFHSNVCLLVCFRTELSVQNHWHFGTRRTLRFKI